MSRLTCTATSPMPDPQPPGTQWEHVDAVDDLRVNDPYWDHYVCPHCGLRFAVEVAE